MTTVSRMTDDAKDLFGNISYFDLTGEVVSQEKKKLKIKIGEENITPIVLLSAQSKNLVGGMIYARGYIENGTLMATDMIAIAEKEENNNATSRQG